MENNNQFHNLVEDMYSMLIWKYLFDPLYPIMKYVPQFAARNWIQQFHNLLKKVMLIMNQLIHHMTFEIQKQMEVEAWDLLGREADQAVAESMIREKFILISAICGVCAMMLSTQTTSFFSSDLLFSRKKFFIDSWRFPSMKHPALNNVLFVEIVTTWNSSWFQNILNIYLFQKYGTADP
jgi:hypothetical protein